ncbi:MAG: type III-A CRISPR-associated RAMP protein Csm3 [Lewinellaceae bacterium]|nr:type III-A CRISPR-associated RAMP protein Csm3 [Saprospiraceae bacterium]MCB9338548.1 type III-A CRISPR-associated RAMP protein Csm3 [Lewinellaceae bacterium]
MNKMNKKIFFSYRMKLETGLRVGDSKEKVQIGGVDAPVVRRKDNYAPYIPGSSIKGKIRCLLELMAGENEKSDSKNNGKLICQLFGGGEDSAALKKFKENGGSKEEAEKRFGSRQSRLIVRDADLTKDWYNKLLNSEYTDLPFTEIKWENSINRLTGTAEAPRQFERIPAGAEFDVQFVINCFETEPHEQYVALLKKGIEALQDDYLGGSGSRGYGRVTMTPTAEPKTKTREDYLKGTDYITD